MFFAPVFFLALLVSCTPQPSADQMPGFLSQFRELPLPYEVQLNGDADIAPYTASEADSAFFAAGTRLIGWMRPLDSVVVVMYAAMGGDYTLPAVRTFVRGRQVEDAVIGLGACGGGDCGFTCTERFKVMQDGSFACEAQIQVFQCDAAGNPTETLVESSSQVNSGEVTASGRLKMRTADGPPGGR